jgi:c-di-GMP-binding flagellar brake protein YcgR
MSEAIADRLAPAAAGDDVGESDSAYVLKARAEIVHVLRDLIRTRAFNTVHMGGAQGTLVTTLLAVAEASGEILFDGSGNEALNRSVLEATTLKFVSSQDKIKIRFCTTAARTVAWQGGEAFAAPIPAELLRLQRREFYRVLAPVSRGVQCIVPVGADDKVRYVETRVYDIGLGGVAIIAQPGQIPAEFGTRYDSCRIVLPDAGHVVVTLEVRSTLEMKPASGKPAIRIGCQFVRPSTATSSLIQRYIMRMERDRKRRE